MMWYRSPEPTGSIMPAVLEEKTQELASVVEGTWEKLKEGDGDGNGGGDGGGNVDEDDVCDNVNRGVDDDVVHDSAGGGQRRRQRCDDTVAVGQ